MTAGSRCDVTRRSLTLVAFWGAKPAPLARWIEECQAGLSGVPELGFVPAPLDQVHGTLVGLETLDYGGLLQRNLARLRGVRQPMDLLGLARFLLADSRWPLELRFGGYGPEFDAFASRGRSPFLRSFSIQDRLAVVVGWPGGRGPAGAWRPGDALAALREEALPFGVLHAYHAGPADRDNDLYLRIGRLAAPTLEPSCVATVEHALRDRLARAAPTVVSLSARDLAFVEYEDSNLPVATSRRIALDADAEIRSWIEERTNTPGSRR